MTTSTRIKKSQPDEGSVYIAPELTGMAATFLQDDDEFVAPWFFPSVPVAQKTGKFKSWKRAHFARSQMAPRGDGVRSNGAGFETEEKSFNCDVFGLHTKHGRQVRANAKKVDIDRASVEFLAEQAKLSMEISFIADFFKAGVWGDMTGVTGTPDDTLGEYLTWGSASAYPLRDLKRALRVGKANGGKRFNKAIFSEKTWDIFSEHPNVVSKIVTGAPGAFAEVTLEGVARYLRMSGGIRIAGSVKTTSEEGATDAYAVVAGDGVLLGHVTDSPMVMQPSAGYTYHWTDYLEGAANEFGAVVKSWYEVGPDAWFYEIGQARDMASVHTGMGMFLASPLAA